MKNTNAAQISEWVKQIQAGTLKFSQVETVAGYAAATVRAAFLSAETGTNLEQLEPQQFDPEAARGRNIENLTGSVEIPVGVAGPLAVATLTWRARGEEFTDTLAENANFYLPLATTEGALVASVNRGLKVMRAAGGLEITVESTGMTRAPLLECESLSQKRAVEDYCRQEFPALQSAVATTSNHAKLIEVLPYSLGRYLWLRCRYHTGEAMGMNMVSKASAAVCAQLTAKFPTLKLIALSGNLCSDKKPAHINLETGRGEQVTARIVIPADLVRTQLGCEVGELVKIAQLKDWVGAVLAGTSSANAHAANMIAAIFAATGQDIAHVGEASQVRTWFAVTTEGDLEAVVELPELPVGTVGGGTPLAGQRKWLELALADVTKAGQVSNPLQSAAHLGPRKALLAGMISGAVLAGELSLHAALAAGTLVSAHEQLGRARDPLL